MSLSVELKTLHSKRGGERRGGDGLQLGVEGLTLHIRIQLTSFFLLHIAFDLFEYMAIRIVLNTVAVAWTRAAVNKLEK